MRASVFVERLEERSLLSVGPGLVKDINLTDTGSNPTLIGEIGGTTLLLADDAEHGRELWRFDGAGATLVKDMTPGPDGTSFSGWIEFDNAVYMAASDGVNGRELWKTDGTEAGTVLLKDINFSGDSSPASFTVMGDFLYFVADDGIHGQELWKTDGTPAGTEIVVDINGSSTGASIQNLTAVGETLFFTANDGVHGTELWKSDGSAAGTGLVKDIRVGASSTPIGGLTNVNGLLFFAADDGVHQDELWKSDGTSAGTVMVKDISSGGNGVPTSSPRMVAFDDMLFFTGHDGTDWGLWKSDGSPAGTTMIEYVFPSEMAVVGNTLFFKGYSDASGAGTELWMTQGTAATTGLVKDIYPGTASSNPMGFIDFAGTLLFRAEDGAHGYELWRSDGTAAGTQMVADIHATDASSPTNFLVVGGEVLFSAADGLHGTELWRTDGTEAGTALAANINLKQNGSNPQWFLDLDGVTLFNANDGIHGTELWVTDGFADGTVLLKDIRPGTGTALQSPPVQLDETTVLFSAYDAVHGTELWRTDGTAAGTEMLADIYPGASSSSPAYFTRFGAYLYFAANDGVHGSELWRTDGTAAGTSLVADIHAGSGNSLPFNFHAADGVLYFSADDGAQGRELWKTDGTAAGTQLVHDIRAGSGSSGPSSPVSVNGVVYFSANDGVTGTELWKSDGTSAGTVQVKDIFSGSGSSFAQQMLVVENAIYFVATDSTHGRELWVTRGSEGNTAMLKDLNLSGDSSPSELIRFGDDIVFSADDGIHGRELFKTDGTGGGTVLLADIAAGGSSPSGLTLANGLLYFSADDGQTGRELWMTNGTAAGTSRVGDIHPGVGASNPAGMVSIDGNIYFAADDGVMGFELWMLPRPLTVDVINGNLVIEEHPLVGSDNDVTIALDASTEELVISEANGPLLALTGGTTAANVARIPLAAVASGQIQVRLGAGTDRLTLDFKAGGMFSVANGVAYAGGADNDTLVVLAGGAENGTYQTGGAVFGSAVATFSSGSNSLEIIADNVEAAAVRDLHELAIAISGGSENLSVEVTDLPGDAAHAVLQGTSGAAAIPTLEFAAVDQLNLDLATGDIPGQEDDTLAFVDSDLAALELAAIRIATGTGADVINIRRDGFNAVQQLRLAGQHISLPNGMFLNNATTLEVQGTIVGELLGGASVVIQPLSETSLGAPASYRGFDFSGELQIGGQTVSLSSAAFARLGALTTIDGGTLVAENGVVLPAGGVLWGAGSIAGRMAAYAGSTVVAAGDLMLGDTNSYAGVFSDGELYVGPHTVTLQDRDRGVLGALTEIGDDSGAGTLNAPNGLLLENGKTLSGHGAINDAFENQGHVIGVGPLPADELEFTGDVTGAGEFEGNVAFSATYSPGNSPAQVLFGGNARLADTATLVVELGGTTAGRDYDQLRIDGHAGLDGTLVVATLDLGNDYEYEVLDRFEILRFASATGDFASIEGLELGHGKRLEPLLESDSFALVVIPSSWQNFEDHFDVDDNEQAVPLDVLKLINEINTHGARVLPEISSQGAMPPGFWDVNGDGLVDPSDVLSVINHINAQLSASRNSGEGEQGAERPTRELSATTWESDASVSAANTTVLAAGKVAIFPLVTASPSPPSSRQLVPARATALVHQRATSAGQFGTSGTDIELDLLSTVGPGSVVDRNTVDLDEDWTPLAPLLSELAEDVANRWDSDHLGYGLLDLVAGGLRSWEG